MQHKLPTKLPETEPAISEMRCSDNLVLKRRWFLAASGTAALSFNTLTSIPALADQDKAEPIPQLKTVSVSAFIDRALEMRQTAIELGDQAYGAVVVRDGKIIGQSWSRVVIDEDPTGHAEMAAIKDAAQRLGSRELEGATMYSSSRPCPMCEAAAYWAGIGRMVYGRNADDAGAPKLCW
ncbi:MAG: nucleoside deaminase [Rhizobiaceae bacterium]